MSVLGGVGTTWANKQDSKRTNKAILQNAAQDRLQQKEFATHGIRWKVADAKAAGIHPLAAMGANTHSPSPIHIGGLKKTDFSPLEYTSRGVGAIGKALQLAELDRMKLSNTLLEQQISGIKNPGIIQQHPQNQDPDNPKTVNDPAKVTPMDNRFNQEGVNSMYQQAIDNDGFIANTYTQKVAEGMESDVTENVRQTAKKAMKWGTSWKWQGQYYKDPRHFQIMAKGLKPLRDYYSKKMLTPEGKKTHEIRYNMAQGQFRVVRKKYPGKFNEYFFDGKKYNFIAHNGRFIHQRRKQ